ncbi:hypothetical protein [Bacteroidetes bacterium endosymbiont of Geopemphigus sp.]|uniref:hypothetical protein n=1 Tax=Bacteroidetes bacterium endosymbiont of Geopemphigus sp. TaxID=2047937 RepID=UPI0011AF61AA|nr:hypothetical protein [Bacteroidetes bacterium endosymbiont of Geopemphigus sp.]
MVWIFTLTTGLFFTKDPLFDQKNELIVNVISSTPDDHYTKDILNIMKPSRHYRYIPFLNPINPKNVHQISSL